MSRTMTNNWIAAATTSPMHPVLLFQGAFKSSTVYLWTGPGNVTWNGNTYLGNGYFIAENGGGDTGDIKAVGLKISLSGVPISEVSFALAEPIQNMLGMMWLGFLDASLNLIDPYLVYEGRLDAVDFVETVKGTVIQISYESRLIDMNRVIPWRYTSQSQQQIYPGDKGFDFVETLDNQGVDYFWGKYKAATTKARTKPRRGGAGGSHHGSSGGGAGFR